MHSSRMRTGRSLTLCQSLLLGGGGSGSNPPQFPPWVWAWRGVSLPGGASLLGGHLGRGVSLPGVPPSWGVSLAGVSLLGVSLLGGLLARGSPCWGGASLLGALLLEGVPPSRVSPCQGCASLPGGLLLGVGIPACTEADPSPCEQNDRQV